MTRRFDSGLLLTLALCLFTLYPLAARPGLPNGTDTLYHLYRVAEMDRSWSHGLLFPQWAEGFYGGYGAPLFHYYASLSYYVTSLFARLFGADTLNSTRLLIAFACLGGAGSLYLFLRRYGGRRGAVLGAVAFAYSPYILFTEPYTRGAYPEMCALALFPFILWRYQRLLEAPNARAFVLAALSSAALIITHNLMALTLTGLLGAWIIWRMMWGYFTSTVDGGRVGIAARLAGRARESLALLAVALGLGLTAYFWLPIASEGDAVHLQNLTGVAQLDYRQFFTPLTHLLAFSPRTDAGAVNGLLHQLNLGMAQWLLALTGVVGFFAVRRDALHGVRVSERTRSIASLQRPMGEVIFFAVATLACVVLMLPLAAGLWAAIPPLAFLQFPWRLLGPAMLGLSVLVSLNGRWLERTSPPAPLGNAADGWRGEQTPVTPTPSFLAHLASWRFILFSALILLIIALALPTLYVDEWEHETLDTSLAAYHAAEGRGEQRATTFTNEYLPAAVSVEPGSTPRLLADYADGYPVNKAHLESLPAGVSVTVTEHTPQSDAWQISAPEAFTLEVLTFDFLGWQATVDGQAVPISAAQPHGFITLPVPAGEHNVRVWLGSTPMRDLGSGISWATLAGLVALALWLARRTPFPVGSPYLASPKVDVTGQGKPTPLQRLVGLMSPDLLLVLVAATLVIIAMRPGLAWVDSPPGQALTAQQQTRYHLGDVIQLLGYDLNSTSFHAGEQVELTLYWYATGPVPHGYAVFVHISNGGPPLAQADKQNPAGRPTVNWTPIGFIVDPYNINLPSDMPAGEYRIMVGLYTCETLPAGECGNGDRLPVRGDDGADLGDAVPLATIKVN